MRLIDLLAAFATGGLLTLMVLFNGDMAAHSSVLFSSLAAHGTGTIAAALALLLLVSRAKAGRADTARVLPRAPLWAYLGGVAGAITVMLTSTTVNGTLALSGTLALGLAGQVVFGLLADRFGLFGLPQRRATLRDMAALGLIGAGSMLLIFAGETA